MTEKKAAWLKFCCHRHPDRIAAVEIHGRYECWECYMGKAVFKVRFGKAAETFYKPGGPGYAGK